MLSRRLIRIKTIKSLYAHFSSGESSLIKSEKEYRHNLKKCYELYVMMLSLITEVADYAARRIEVGEAKMRPTEAEKNPNRRFVDNRFIDKIRNSDNITDAIVREKTSWRGNDLIVKELYSEMVEAPYFKAYMNSPKNTFADDRKVLLDFYRNHIEDNEALEEALEGMSIFWGDDINFALLHVISTYSAVKESDEDVAVLPMYKNDDDREYAELLYRKSLVNSAQYYGYIEKLTKNWDFERIAFMDKIIMLAAIAELIEFQSIPVKVTLDEYIEISKYYSTSGSSTFINGIIDKAIETLTADGTIVKSGRGLIEG